MSIEQDKTSLTGSSCFRSPRNIAVWLFFYVFLTMFKVCLTSMIKINAATVGDFSFHCRAMELLYHTRALLSMKDAR
jgi:hypothetical protein